MKVFKSSIVMSMLLLVSTSSIAGGYAGVFGSSVVKSSNKSAEIFSQNNTANIVIGAKTNSPIGVKADISFNNIGAGVSAAGYIDIGKLEFSAGVTKMTDNSLGSVPSLGKLSFNNANSRQEVNANYIGLKYSIFAVRYIEYAVSHTYSSRVQVGHKHVEGKKKPIYKSNYRKANFNRGQLWVGVVFPF